MRSLLATRRRAEDFAQLVDGSRTTHDPALRPLLALTDRLRHPAEIEPSDTFRTELRERLLAAATDLEPETEPVPEPAQANGSHVRLPIFRRLSGPSGPRVRLLTALTVVSMVLALAGVATFARQALPGDALYSIKRGIEQTQIALTTSSESRARRILAKGNARLDEVAALIGTDVSVIDEQRTVLISDALTDFNKVSREGGDLLILASQETGNTEVLHHLRQYTADSTARLHELEQQVPTQVLPHLTDATETLTLLDQQLTGLCGLCGLVGTPEQPEPTVAAPGASPEPTDPTASPAAISPTPGVTASPNPTVGPTSSPSPSTSAPTSSPTSTPSIGSPVPSPGSPSPSSPPVIELPCLLPLLCGQ